MLNRDHHGSWIYTYLCNQCLSPLKLWFRNLFRRGVCNMSDNVCQWLVAGWWFSPGTSVYSTNKTDRHNIAEILLKVALNTTTLNLNVQFTSFSLSIFSVMAVYDMHKYLTKINTSSITDSYPAMTAFTDQYSLPNIFFWYWSVINKTYKCKLRPHRGILFSNTYTILFQILLSSSSKCLFTI